MVGRSLNTIDKNDLVREITELDRRIETLERLLSGEPVGTARIENASITDAKVVNLSATKVTTGTFTVDIDVGNPASGFLRIGGGDNRILGNNGTSNKFVLGEV